MTLLTHSSTDDIIPILSLSDPLGGIVMLENVFGFERCVGEMDGGILMELADQKILIVSGRMSTSDGCPHHIALSVPDVDVAMRKCMARGGQLAASMTPDGPLEIAEFWGDGVRYVFFDGPEGALIEFCKKKGQPIATDWAQGHIGIECDDLANTQAIFIDAGCGVIATYSLQRSEGVTDVVFLQRGNSVVELFRPPKNTTDRQLTSAHGWAGVRDANL